MEDPKSFQDIARERLVERVTRLGKLLTMNASLSVIATEIGMVTEAGIALCGPECPIGIEKIIREKWLIDHGFCIFCTGDSPRRATNPQHVCDICVSQAMRGS